MDAEAALAIGDRGLRSYLIAFAVTQLVEAPIYVAALQRARGPDATPPRSPRQAWTLRAKHLGIGFGASAITHPIVWFAMPLLWMWLYATAQRLGAPSLGLIARTLGYGLLAEAFAVLAEGLYLRAFGVKRAMAWALVANAASVLVGTAVVWTLG